MAVIVVKIHVDDLPSTLSLYDRIQVWKAPTLNGVYVEVTGPEETAASIAGSVTGPWNLNGLSLTVTINHADPITINFSGTNPMDIVTVLNKINLVKPGLASKLSSSEYKVKLTSPLTGTGSSLLIAGNAAAILGLSTTQVNGKAARLPMLSPTVDYAFKDLDGSSSYFYKTRFYSTKTDAVSAYDTPRQSPPTSVIASVAKATIRLSDPLGAPIVGRRIIFVPVNNVTSNGYTVLPGGMATTATTDSSGYAEINLVIGAKFRVFFEGTSYAREFIVPNSVSFDLLTTLSTSPDVFSIVQAPPYPIRTN